MACYEFENGFIAYANIIFNATRYLAYVFHIFSYVSLSDQYEETREIHVKTREIHVVAMWE